MTKSRKLVSKMSERRLFMKDVDPSSDIDFKNVPSSVWELVVETTSKNKKLRLMNMPFNLTLLEFGPNLSLSLAEAFYLPITLFSYKGPVVSGMRLPPDLKKLTVIETSSSLPTSSVNLPPNLKTFVVENPLKFSNLDGIKLPSSLETFQIVGKHNCSLEKLVFPPSLTSIDVGGSIQPVDLLATRLKIVQQVEEDVEEDVTDFKDVLGSNPLVVSSSPENSRILGALRKKMPRLEKLHVILDDEVLISLGDVWTEVLLEGRVQVRDLTVTNMKKTSCLGDCAEVFKRSSVLGRKLCRKLIILSEKYSYVAHLNLARSLKLIGGISLEISYMDNEEPSECLLARLSQLMDLRRSGTKYQNDSFGAKNIT